MSTSTITPQIQGLPPGAIVRPIGGGAPGGSQIQGLPPGAIVRPIGGSDVEDSPDAAPPTAQDDPSHEGVTGFFNDFYTGVAREAASSIAGLDKLVSRIPVVGKALTTPLVGAKTSDEAIADERSYADQPDENMVQSGGRLAESALEFFMGDEALKGLSFADRLKKVAPLMKALEKSPRMAAAVESAIRTGAVSGAQTLVKTGGDIGAAAQSALGGAALGGATSGLASAIADAAPATTEVAGETMRVPKVPKVPAEVADQQAAGQRVISKTAQDAAAQGVDLVNDKPQIEYDSGPNGEQGEPTGNTTIPKAPIVDVPAAVARVQSFGDAADEVEAAAKRAYTIMDASTDGQFTALRDRVKLATREVNNAGTIGERDAAQARLDMLTQKMNQMFESTRGEVSPRDWAAANLAWRNARTLRMVHDAVESTFDTDAGFSQRSGTYRGFNGNMLRARLNRLTQAVGEKELNRVVGQAGMDNLRKVAELTRTNADRAKFGGAVQEVGSWLAQHKGEGAAIAAGLVGHAVRGSVGGAAAAIGTEAAYLAARKVMQMVATNPRIGQQLSFAVESGARPAFFAPLIGQMIRDADRQQSPPPDAGETEDMR